MGEWSLKEHIQILLMKIMDSKDALELWLVRHGQSTWNAEGRIQGHKDAPLSDLGKQQASALSNRLAHLEFDAYHSSDSSRAYDTGCLAMPSVDIRKDERLRELSFGEFEGKKRSELSEAEQEVFSMWRKDRGSHVFEAEQSYGIESDQALISRFASFVSDLPETGKVIVFSHGGLIRLVLHHFLGASSNFQRTFNISNTSITKIQIFQDDEFVRIISANDIAHLETL